MSQDETYDYFTDLYDIPYTVVTFLYISALFLISSIVAARRISKCKACKCCKSCCDGIRESRIVGWITQFNSWLVRLIFGKSEGISEDKQNSRETEPPLQAERDEAGATTVYIQGHEIQVLDVNILGTVILCFSLLMAIAAYGVYLLDVSHTCTEDPAIYCFPRFISDDVANPNISEEDMMYPITDCSQWVNSSIAPQITFQCFRFAYNGQAALATAGGLLALFTVAMRITITIFLKVFKLLRSCGTCLVVLQVAVVTVLLLADAAIAVVVMAFQLHDQIGMTEADTSPVAEQTASYLADNGLQFLVIMGTATLLLLIPWSNYTPQDPKEKKGQRRDQYELKDMP